MLRSGNTSKPMKYFSRTYKEQQKGWNSLWLPLCARPNRVGRDMKIQAHFDKAIRDKVE